jgi:hypothetical protein
MNNRVYQSDGTTILNIGDWHIGIYVLDDGDLCVYIDSDVGNVLQYDEDIAQDERQWGRRFTPENKIRTANPLRRRMTLR